MVGAYPDQVTAFEQGRVDSPICPLCQEEEGTLQHVYWRCTADCCLKVRKELADPAIKDNFCDLVKRGAEAKQDRWLWTRGLQADPTAGIAVEVPEDKGLCGL